jgi:hypothetical protein
VFFNVFLFIKKCVKKATSQGSFKNFKQQKVQKSNRPGIPGLKNVFRCSKYPDPVGASYRVMPEIEKNACL